MPPFFIGWSLWIQMTFVLFCALVATFGIGMAKNLFVWHRNRRYLRLHGASIAAGDIETQPVSHTIQAEDDPPFGIRALEQGIQIEGVYISRGNTPAPSTHVPSRRPSPSPSTSSLPYPYNNFVPSWSGQSGIAMPQPVSPGYRSNISHLSGASSPGFDFNSAQSLETTDYPNDYPRHSRNSKSADFHYTTRLTRNSATLDALEGRGIGRHRKSISKSSTAHSFRSRHSARDSSPSPPALTDGASRPDSPMSADTRLNLPTFLSESNHRLSHVAETGQLAPRFRHTKTADSVNFPTMAIAGRGSPFFFDNRTPPLPSPTPIMKVSISPPMISAPPPAVTRPAPIRNYSDSVLQPQPLAIPTGSIINNQFELQPLSPIDFEFVTDEKPSRRESTFYRRTNSTFEMFQGVGGARGSVPPSLVAAEAKIIKKKRSSRKIKKRRKSESQQYKGVNFIGPTEMVYT